MGERVVLVPYKPEHVETYHRWMLDEDLRELTASEPLTLEEEYEMQTKWRNDPDKLTFIILARQPDVDTSKLPMIGDVNLFLKGDVDDPESDFEAEAEIMIAEPTYRRQGLALEALQLMLSFATTSRFIASTSVVIPEPDTTLRPLPIDTSILVVRISASNAPSVALFRCLGFKIVRHVEVFNELEMRFDSKAT
ncbi:hypothetical protein CONPUDRAFT_151165 [Coniophora puteana RWD-64-598 SS2]|uniref:N-acetyltransferase domain-containing protein n=1 Tax=Coniophora puteana (strain RWD-64-598) TaxID=741705 RepID=A0A5M3MZR3_CONPW|nr:uncharacterized protein CONPUDRAFT_151165 [Coniophora puteana RWD-64-598 SS2]EIW84121.1 hypothetical protein CONPUDRAFT_151165 [Coniophora puteana RWD-64-598 SS2]